jgi:hypothetical protein
LLLTLANSAESTFYLRVLLSNILPLLSADLRLARCGCPDSSRNITTRLLHDNPQPGPLNVTLPILKVSTACALNDKYSSYFGMLELKMSENGIEAMHTYNTSTKQCTCSPGQEGCRPNRPQRHWSCPPVSHGRSGRVHQDPSPRGTRLSLPVNRNPKDAQRSRKEWLFP